MPADAINKLKEIVNPRITHPCTTNGIELHEKDKNAELKHVVINGVDGDVIAVELDKVGFANKVLLKYDNNCKVLKSCDAVIFCQLDNQAYILVLDMKSSTPADNDHIAQLVAGDCFADYLLAVLKRFEKIEVTEGWQRRYFIFHCGNNKRTTLPEYVQNPPKNNRADKAHILLVNNGETVSLRKLLNKPL